MSVDPRRTRARLASGLAGITVLAGLALAARPAAAQSCGGQRSSCRTCHEERAERPVNSDGTSWHEDHAFSDFCAACHGGDATATDRQIAHFGLVEPLATDRCTSCHADPAPLLARYTAERTRRRPPPHTAATNAPGAPRWPDLAATILVIAIGIGGAVGITRAERRRRGNPTPIFRSMLAALRALEWRPVSAGIGLGLVITASLAFGHRLSGSAAYQQLGGAIGTHVAPTSIYFHQVLAPLAMSWDLWAVLGAVLGAFLSAVASGAFRIRTMPDRGWVEIYGPSIARRWMIAFIGSALTAFAAGIAGGCTASLAMSGGAVLVPAAFAFMAGMFAGGIPTALFVHRRGGAP